MSFGLLFIRSDFNVFGNSMLIDSSGIKIKQIEVHSNKILIFLVSFSAGGLMGGAFFHLLPESIEEGEKPLLIFVYVLVGFCLFFLIERFLRWHHCHDKECDNPSHLGYINLSF